MSIKAMKLALEALENASPAAWASRVDSDTMKSIWRKHAEALEGLQVLLAELDNASCKSVQKRLEAQQPATGEPVQADSSEHLRVISSLGAALRRLSFAAQTTGGTDGPDAELQSAIGQAEQALSLGGIWQAMSATGEPEDFPAGAIVNGRTLMDRIEAHPFESEGGDLRMCSDWHELRRCFEHLADYVSPRPAPSVPKDDQIAALVNKVRDIARMFHDHQSLRERIAIELVPVLKASQEVKSNAERWRHAIADGENQSMNFLDIFDDWDGDGDFVEVFDAAMLAAKERL